MKKEKKIDESELTEVNLQEALWRTRQQSGGISIKRIAEIIKKELDEAEVEALIKTLTQLT